MQSLLYLWAQGWVFLNQGGHCPHRCYEQWLGLQAPEPPDRACLASLPSRHSNQLQPSLFRPSLFQWLDSPAQDRIVYGQDHHLPASLSISRKETPNVHTLPGSRSWVSLALKIMNQSSSCSTHIFLSWHALPWPGSVTWGPVFASLPFSPWRGSPSSTQSESSTN